jgi:hypothetical protein
MAQRFNINLLSFCMLLFAYATHAQNNSNEANTLFGGQNKITTKDLGFFIAPGINYSEMDGSPAALFNLRGGLNIKDRFTFGAYGSTYTNQIMPRSETVPNVYMDFWSVGAFAEYTPFAKRLVHLSFPLTLGYGEVQMDNYQGELDLGEANFFHAEASALLEVNLHKYVRFNIGAGYRFISDMNYRNFNQDALSGLTAFAGLKFGLFR